MRTQDWTLAQAVAHSPIPGRGFAPGARLARTATGAALLAGAALLTSTALHAAQAPAPANQDAPAAQHLSPTHHHKHSPATPLVQPDPTPVVPVTPAEPEKPKWPAFDPAAPAAVVWDSQGLRIDATNSSLQQILKDVSTATGAKVEGLSSDERVFGAYGPGQARDVLSQLLQGSGYNVLMIGDQGQGTPREIVLSTRQAGPAQNAVRNNPANSSNDEENEVEDQPVQPEQPTPRPGFPPGGPPRSPQQIMQEMQQRQQQMQQQQPPAQPPN